MHYGKSVVYKPIFYNGPGNRKVFKNSSIKILKLIGRVEAKIYSNHFYVINDH